MTHRSGNINSSVSRSAGSSSLVLPADSIPSLALGYLFVSGTFF